MATVTPIRSKMAPGPRVPETYVRAGRDEPNSTSADRPYGSMDDHILSDAAKDRLKVAGVLLAAGAVVVGSVYGLAHTDTPKETKNPSGIMTSGAESE